MDNWGSVSEDQDQVESFPDGGALLDSELYRSLGGEDTIPPTDHNETCFTVVSVAEDYVILRGQFNFGGYDESRYFRWSVGRDAIVTSLNRLLGNAYQAGVEYGKEAVRCAIQSRFDGELFALMESCD